MSLIETTDPELIGPQSCAKLLDNAFAEYNFKFRKISQRAAGRFRDRDWIGSQQDAVERIDLYDKCVHQLVHNLGETLGENLTDRQYWVSVKELYQQRIQNYLDCAFHKTFFNSVTRRVFNTVGVDKKLEFFAEPLLKETGKIPSTLTRKHVFRGSTWRLSEEALAALALDIPWSDFSRCVDSLKQALEESVAAHDGHFPLQKLEFVRPLFYRDHRAYLIGRQVGETGVVPLVVALRHDPDGIVVDGILTRENDLSILFGFARSYLHVDLDPVRDAVLFLKSLLPRKPVGELYTMLGRAKQGKTERFRTLMLHLSSTDDQFIDAAFDKGMVMIVFKPQLYPVVLKVIRDRFSSSKTVGRKDVIDRYHLVFKHDRAGRLVDAQEFRDLKLPRKLFSENMLAELTTQAAITVSLDGNDVVLDHVYIERELVPLNQFLQTTQGSERRQAILDYGQAIRDLSMSNIFPGDLLLKNFGVTRHGRVIFYDYDELCLVSECNFRDLPAPRTMDEEMATPDWYYVADNDVFPEQFITFLGLDEELTRLFKSHHGDLLTADYWRDLKIRIQQGEIFEILPYKPL